MTATTIKQKRREPGADFHGRVMDALDKLDSVSINGGVDLCRHCYSVNCDWRIQNASAEVTKGGVSGCGNCALEWIMDDEN